ncbi:ribosomal protein S19 family protein, partial [Candidatus Dependentiae bacterium]|nr:ribosomal protein S19 family protein [Candidatus Dependentiae bacterium]
MARSIKKGFFVSEKLLKKLNIAKEKGEKKVIKTWSRASMVIPDMVG